jgi:protease I
VPSDLKISDALVLPGGQINPDKLRTDQNAVNVVKQFLQAGKVVAAICQGPWLLVEADGWRAAR